MIVYILLLLSIFIISSFGFIIKNTFLKRTVFPVACFLVIYIFCSLKSTSIGIDTKQYSKIFHTIASSGWEYCFSARTEAGFNAFTKIITIFTSSFTVYNFIFYFIVLFSFLLLSILGFKNPSMPFSLIVAFGLQFFLTAYRQTMAIALITYATIFALFTKNKIIRVFLSFSFVAMAFSFHVSAIVGIAIPIALFASKYKKPPFSLIIGLYCVFFLGVRSINLIVSNIINTSYYPNSRNAVPSTSFLCLAIFSIAYLLNYHPLFLSNYPFEQPKTKIKKAFYCICSFFRTNFDGDKDVVFKTALFISVVASFVMLFSISSTIFVRIYYYFIPLLCVCVAKTIENRTLKTPQMIGAVFASFISIVYFCISLVKSGYIDYYIPYEIF